VHPFDITHNSVIRDDIEDDVYQRKIRKWTEGDTVFVEVVVPGNLVPPVLITTDNPDIRMHELRKYLAVKNQEAAIRRLPESKRRREDRRQRLMTSVPLTACPGCGGRGWVDNFDNTQFPCPTCQPNV
jgi:hypothetical protein